MFLTNDDRFALMRDQWIKDAKVLLQQRRAELTPQEAQEIAEAIFVSAGNDEYGFDWVSVFDAVNEELYYWGE